MARPLRIEFPGAIYHITARGNRQERIFVDDDDRRRLLEVVAQGMLRHAANVLAFCLMGNHYHLVLCTGEANLSRLMRHINGEYTQAFNRRHDLRGHLFQGRFNAILVDSDAYLMELCRYVELNPVRAGLVSSVADWGWSSYRSNTGSGSSLPWLDTSRLHAHLLGRDALSSADRLEASRMYSQLVADGLGVDLWPRHLRKNIYLGDERFIAEAQARADPVRMRSLEIPRRQREHVTQVNDWIAAGFDRDQAVTKAYLEGGWPMSAIARQAGRSLRGDGESADRTGREERGGGLATPADARPGTVQDLTPCKT